VINPVTQDHMTLWPTGVSPPSKAFRNLAIAEDVKALSDPGVVLFALPGWSQYPEAAAMIAVAKAMDREIIELNEEFTKEDHSCPEY
jgi:hypothetical protein